MRGLFLHSRPFEGMIVTGGEMSIPARSNPFIYHIQRARRAAVLRQKSPPPRSTMGLLVAACIVRKPALLSALTN